MGQAGYKCISWRWVRQVTSAAAGDGSGWSQIPSVAAGAGSVWSQVSSLAAGDGSGWS